MIQKGKYFSITTTYQFSFEAFDPNIIQKLKELLSVKCETSSLKFKCFFNYYDLIIFFNVAIEVTGVDKMI
jgi:hypothetical protein